MDPNSKKLKTQRVGTFRIPGRVIKKPLKKPDIRCLIFHFSITCQAGNDQDRKGFCAVYSTLARLTSTSKILYTDAEQENVEKKCMNVCKKVRKGNNSHKEGRNILCKAYGKNSYSMMTLLGLAKCQDQAVN